MPLVIMLLGVSLGRMEGDSRQLATVDHSLPFLMGMNWGEEAIVFFRLFVGLEKEG